MYKCIHIIHVVDILLLNVQYLLTCMYKEWAESVVFVLFLDPGRMDAHVWMLWHNFTTDYEVSF